MAHSLFEARPAAGRESSRFSALRFLNVCAAAALVALAACSSPSAPSTASGSVGAVGLNLDVAPGTTLSSVAYTITGPASFLKTGTIDVSHTGTLSALLSPIPAGTGFTISLDATAAGGGTTCAGMATFDVMANQTSTVVVHLTCHEAARTGSILVNGSLNLCPAIDGISASNAEVFVGYTVNLGGEAHDLDQAPAALSYRWTASNGQLSDTTARNPVFTCTSAGAAVITLTVSDGDPAPGCAGTMSLTLTCTPNGAGGGAGSVASGGVSGSGGTSAGGAVGTGGAVSSGGTSSAGGTVGTGGSVSAGGTVGTGGVVGTGGMVAMGGTVGTGGAVAGPVLAVYRVGDGTTSLSGSANPVFVDRFSAMGMLLSTTAMPATTPATGHRLVSSGTAVSEGFITRSTDGRFLLLTGYDTALGTASLTSTTATAAPRTIGRIDAAGNVDTTTALTDGASGASPRAAASTDGASLWFSGGGSGVRFATLGASTSLQLSSTVTNLRQVAIFGGQLYVSDSSGSAVRLGAVGTGLPTTAGQTITNLPGIPASTGSPYGFFLADLDAGTPGLDVLYVADDGAGLLKYSLVNGAWTANGMVGAASDAYRGVTGVVSGNSVTLYATRKGGSGSTGGGELVSLVDTSGYAGSFVAAPAVLATAAANTVFRGVALAP